MLPDKNVEEPKEPDKIVEESKSIAPKSLNIDCLEEQRQIQRDENI